MCVVCSPPLSCDFFSQLCDWPHPESSTQQWSCHVKTCCSVVLFFLSFSLLCFLLFLVHTLHWLTDGVDLDGCSLPTVIKVISLFGRETPTKLLDRNWDLIRASSVVLVQRLSFSHLYLFFNDECEMFSWMSEEVTNDDDDDIVKKRVIDVSKGTGFGCYDACDWGLSLVNPDWTAPQQITLNKMFPFSLCFLKMILNYYFWRNY